MKECLVIKSTGSSYIVYTPDHQSLECHIKGNFRIRGIRTTNPVAVGDLVTIEDEGTTHWITEIEPRRNYIIRRSTNLSKEAHILAANIDQVGLLVTLHHPQTSTTFIDRFLATAEAYRVPAFLIFNKTDLLSGEDKIGLQSLRDLYESLGYPTYAISAKNLNEEQLDMLFAQMEGKTTLLSGNSGVGKSTLLNAIFGEEKTRTGEISASHLKGQHTTTFSQMFPLKEIVGNRDRKEMTGWLIDTPGIKGFGTIEMEKMEVGHYFREIFEESQSCKYSDCTHTGEPGCAVFEAVAAGRIAASRYESYLSILGDTDEGKYR